MPSRRLDSIDLEADLMVRQRDQLDTIRQVGGGILSPCRGREECEKGESEREEAGPRHSRIVTCASRDGNCAMAVERVAEAKRKQW